MTTSYERLAARPLQERAILLDDMAMHLPASQTPLPLQSTCSLDQSGGLPWYSSFLSGSFGGLMAGIIGHPLDTMKLMQQTRGHTFETALALARRHPPALFRGLAPAIGVQIVTSALLFGVYDRARDTGFSPVVAGAITGSVLAPFTGYLEALKCRAQVNSSNPARLGLCATALRCGVGNSAYFTAYEHLSSLLPVGMAGTLAGVAYWTVALPLDNIKSRQQVDGTSFVAAARSISGPGRLWAGWTATILRAGPVSATCFQCVEAANALQTYLTQDR